MRCIDADALIKDVLDLQDCYNGFSDTYDKACIIGLIDEMPTIKPPYKLDEWCTDCKEYDQKRNCCPRYNRVIRAAVEEARANFTPKQGQWIPVSERLPEINERDGDVQKYYLVQNEYGDMMVACYKGNKTSTWWEQMYKYDKIEDSIVAWMPLPEPYKEEVEAEEDWYSDEYRTIGEDNKEEVTE